MGDDDYVLHYLDDVIGNGGLLVAIVEGRAVGMVNFEVAIDGAGWLSMARTHPEWRGVGIASLLVKRAADEAYSFGIEALRLWTHARNRAALRSVSRSGFHLVCEATHITKILNDSDRTRVHNMVATKGDTLDYLRMMNGYIGYGRHIVIANSKTIAIVRKKRELHSVRRCRFVMTDPRMQDGVTRSSFALLDGPASTALASVRDTAAVFGAHEIDSYVPRRSPIVHHAVELGFVIDDWGSHCKVMESRTAIARTPQHY